MPITCLQGPLCRPDHCVESYSYVRQLLFIECLSKHFLRLFHVHECDPRSAEGLLLNSILRFINVEVMQAFAVLKIQFLNISTGPSGCNRLQAT
jgi:hypothetical protein